MAPSNAPAPIFIMLLKRLLALAFVQRVIFYDFILFYHLFENLE